MSSNLVLLFNFVQEQGISLIVDKLVELNLSRNIVVVADAVVFDRSFEDVTRSTVGSLLGLGLVVRCISEVGLGGEGEAVLLEYGRLEGARGLERVGFGGRVFVLVGGDQGVGWGDALDGVTISSLYWSNLI